jgi:hypothetical protein
LLVKNGLPPELFLGATAAPPGGGGFSPPPTAAAPAPAARPAPAAGVATGPSAGALRALRERAIGSLTSAGVVDAAAAAGNPAAIAEQKRRAESLARANEQQLRGLGG